MAQVITIYKICSFCNGTGEITTSSGIDGQTVPCTWPGCINGFVSFGKYNNDPGHDGILDKCNDIIDKCNDIIEAIQT